MAVKRCGRKDELPIGQAVLKAEASVPFRKENQGVLSLGTFMTGAFRSASGETLNPINQVSTVARDGSVQVSNSLCVRPQPVWPRTAEQ